MSLSKAKILFFIKDEKHAAKEYAKLGLPFLAKDEARHRKYFQKLLKAKRR